MVSLSQACAGISEVLVLAHDILFQYVVHGNLNIILSVVV